MFVRLTLPDRALLVIRAKLGRRDGGDAAGAVDLPATLVASSGTAHADHIEIAVPAGAAAAAPPSPCTVRVYPLARRLIGIPHLYWQGCARVGAAPRVDLAFNPGRGCSAALLIGQHVAAVDEVCLAGARMERWRPGRVPGDLLGEVPADGRFSRYAGALGGDAAPRRIAALRVGVFGQAPAAAEFGHAVGCCGASVHRLGVGDPLAAVARADVVVFDVLELSAADGDALATAASALSRVVVAFLGGVGVWLAVPGDGCAHGLAASGPRPTPRHTHAPARFVASHALFLLERLVTGDVLGSCGAHLELAVATGATMRGLPPPACRCGVWPESPAGVVQG